MAYVLGALDAAARERFEAHAATCAECLRELDELRPVADGLGLAILQRDPPPELEQRMLARARELAPAARVAAVAVSPPPAVRVALPPPPAQRWQPALWAQRLAAPLAVAATVVSLVSAGYAVDAHRQVEGSTTYAAQLAETLAIMYQPGRVGRELSGEAWPAAKGMIYMVPGGQEAVVVTYDLPRLAKQESYQFWLGNPDQEQRVSGGVFKVDDRGRGQLIVRTKLSQYRSCGVTKEPARGSTKPTGPRMLSGSL